MKKNIFFSVAFCISLSTFGQIQKGTGFLSGALAGNYSNSNSGDWNVAGGNKINSWNLFLSYGGYISDNIAIGVGAGFDMSKYESSHVSYSSGYTFYENTTQSTLYYVAPFIRFSKSISDKLYCFGTLSGKAGMGPSKSISESNSYNSSSESQKGKQTVFGGGLTGGLNYFLNRHFALSLTYGNFSYAYTKIEQESGSYGNFSSSSDGFNINMGLSSISMGLQYFINCVPDKK